MKFSHSWLLKYLDTNLSPEEIAPKLVDLGLEVEALENPAAKLKGFVYAKVVERVKHPEADRLSLCKVDAGGAELVQVVCGAPNVKANMGVAFASVGTVIPITNDVLKKGTIRNVDSFGMLCSARELMLGEESDGIMDLGLEYTPGTPLLNIIGTDAVYDVSITPNRGDCFAVYGIARDLAAIGVGRLLPFPQFTINANDPAPTVTINTPYCHQFILSKITNVKNAESTPDLKSLLASAGQKAINGLVDITNYMCIGFGRPMHVFDADKVKGNLVIREAAEGEKLQALNDQEYTLEAGMIVISDDSGVVSLAGIMGGKSTAVDENTTNVLLESALFDSISIATTGQKLNLTSDSRMRFERGVDLSLVEPCLDLATSMILENFGGFASKKSASNSTIPSNKAINFDTNLVKKRLGLEISIAEITNILEKLGCQVNKNTSALDVISPTWRHDLNIPEDLVEEIARIKGYHNIQPLSLPLSQIENTSDRFFIQKHLSGKGFLETVNWSFIDMHSATNFTSSPDQLLVLSNPISEDLNTMRPSLVPSLLKIAEKNSASARYNGSLFEVAPIHLKTYKDFQTDCVAGLRFGSNHLKHWSSSQRKVDAYDSKNDLLSTLQALGISEKSVQLSNDGPNYYHPGRKGCIKQGQKVLAYFGEIHPSISPNFTSVGFEIFLNHLPPVKFKKVQKNFSNLMPLRRDFAFVLHKDIQAQNLVKAIEKSSPLIESIEIFDLYEGSNVEGGKKSLAIAITLQPIDKSFTENELENLHNSVVSNAAKIGAVLRN